MFDSGNIIIAIYAFHFANEESWILLQDGAGIGDWNSVFLTLDTLFPFTILISHHILKVFFFNLRSTLILTLHLRPQLSVLLERRKIELNAIFITSCSHSLTLFYQTFFFNQHIQFFACRIKFDFFCIQKRLIESSLGISTLYKMKHFIGLIRYLEVFSSRSSTCYIPGTVLGIRSQ